MKMIPIVMVILFIGIVVLISFLLSVVFADTRATKSGNAYFIFIMFIIFMSYKLYFRYDYFVLN